MHTFWKTWGIRLALGLLTLSASADLVWHSALDGNADAIVGQNGVPTGTPTFTADMNGNPFGAVDFSGGNFLYEVDATPEITSLSAGTMSLWVRWNNTAGEQGIAAMGQSGGGQTEYFTVMRQNASTIRTDLDDGDDGAGRIAANATGLSADTWYHVVATFSAQTNVTLYVDGSQTGTGSLATGEATVDPVSTWLIGSERTGARFLDGSLDDVRFYDHALNASEVGDLFLAGPLYTIPEPSSATLMAFGVACVCLYRRRRA